MVLHARIRIVHAACIDVAFRNPSWFALNIFMRWMLSLVPSFANVLGTLILSWAYEFDHVCLMKPQPKLLFIVGILISFTLFSSRCSSPLLRGFSPASRIEHIPKYSSIEKFMKLPFQQVVIRFKQSYDRFTLALRAVQKISECTTFDVLAITSCGKLRLTSFLIRWNRNFMGLLNIQKYTAIFFWGRA